MARQETDPGIVLAKRTLSRAFRELDNAEPGDIEVRRQIAEKGWRAVREAIYTVVECATGERPRGTIRVDAIEAVEGQVFGRPRGCQPLAQAYGSAIDVLHGACFYEGACPSDDWLRSRLENINADIAQAETDVIRCRLQHGKRRHRPTRSVKT